MSKIYIKQIPSLTVSIYVFSFFSCSYRPTAKSYMKMADAYLDKGQYALASKQFLKVIKKVSDHLPAHLGYATAIERDGKSKQIIGAALAYGNATRVAITQAPPIDPL